MQQFSQNTAEHQQKTLDTGKDYKDPCITGQDEKKKGEGGEEEAGRHLYPGAGELKHRRDSQIRRNPLSDGETPSRKGKSIGTEGKHLRLSEEGEVADLWQMGQSEKYTDDQYHSPMSPGLGCVFTGV